jgi:hypothetical protein
MNRNTIPPWHSLEISFPTGVRLACLVVLLWLSRTAVTQTQREADGSTADSLIHVTHLLGFDGARHNAHGDLRIQGDALHFLQDGCTDAQISTSSIQDISLGQEDQQIGGVPMMLGKAAVPFGGGRVVSLFSHKKYDSVTLEYVDSNGGFHDAIFRLSKGQGKTLKEILLAGGAHITLSENRVATPKTPEGKNEKQ